YTLVVGTGSTDNASFAISGNQLQTNAVFDFETKSSYSIRVRSTDSGTCNLFFEKVFTITVTDVNETPTNIALSPSSVAENQPSGTVVGTFSTTDQDAGDTHTYTLVVGTGSTDNASFTISGNQLQTNAVFDFETKSSYSIRVRTTDSGTGNLFFEKVFTITVTDANDAPTNIALSNSSVNENQPVGTAVGNFSTTDPDVGDTHTYMLVAGAGSTDNASFTISGNQLQTNAVFDFETKSSYSIRVRTTDSGTGNLFFEKVFTVTVLDLPEAPITTADTYDTIGNTELRVDRPAGTTPNVSVTSPASPPNRGVLHTDTDSDNGQTNTLIVSGISGCGDTIAPYVCTTTNGGTVSMETDGSFSYVPPAGNNADDTFTYVARDTDGLTSTAMVTLKIHERVWFVKNNATAGGLGRSADPFDTLAEAQTASSANDYIFVYLGDGTSTGQSAGITLKAGQHLLGEHIGLTVAVPGPGSFNGTPLPTNLGLVTAVSGNRPLIDNSAANGNAVSATDLIPAEINGFSLAGNATGGNAIDWTTTGAFGGTGTFSIQNNVIRSAGAEGIDVNAGGTGTLTLSITGNGWNAAGTHTGNAVDINRTGGQLQLDFSNNTGILSAANAVNINGGAIASTTITGFANNSVHQNTVGTGISITNAKFDANAGTAAYEFVSGGSTVVGASGNGVGGSGVVLSNVAGDLRFTDLDIFADGGAGLSATGTGAVNIAGGTGTQVTVGAGVAIFEAIGGPAVSATNATIDLQPTSIKSTNSSTTGVSLDTVTGTFAAGSGSAISNATGTSFNVNAGTATISYGGTITNSAGRSVSVTSKGSGSTTFNGAITATGGTGIFLNNNTGSTISFTKPISLTTGANDAFTATGGGTVTSTDTTSTITTTTGTALNVANTTIGASGLKFTSVSAGTAASGPASGIVLNNTGASGSLTVNGGTIQKTTSHGVSLSSTLSPSFNAVTIKNTGGSGVNGTTVTNFTFTNGTIDTTGSGAAQSNIAFNTAVAGTENNVSGTVMITGNSLLNSVWHGVDVQNFSGTLSSITISNNTITSPTTAATSNGSGIRLQALGSATTAATVTQATLSTNIISNFPSGAGILAQGGNANAAGPIGNFGIAGSGSNIINITNNTIKGQSAAVPLGTSAIIASVGGKGQGNFNISNNGTVANPLTNMAGTAILCGGNGDTTSTFTVNGNVIVANNTVASNGVGGGTGVTFGTSDTPDMTWTITSNNVSATDGNGILAVARGATGNLKVKIQNNTVAAPLTGVREGIRVDAGNASSVNDSVCLNITGNTSAGSGGVQGLGLRKQGTAPATNAFGINGMAATSTPGVETYVNGLNPAGNGTLLLSATSGFSNCSLP
ncbi:MAG TPA: cadherin domain-containing protein, partial [Thermoanaerobaculia bacterium]|nr:cadherin domain-containing protein [Thermoanaerobaculia bacterium]